MPTDVKDIEDRIKQELTRLPGPKRAGMLEAYFDGHVSFGGQLKYGIVSLGRLVSIAKALDRPVTDDNSLSILLSELAEAAKHSPNGPWYALDVTIKNKTCDFKYYYMNDPELTVQNVKRTQFGRLPEFLYVKHFNKELVDAADENDIFYALENIVHKATERDVSLHEDMLDFYAIYDWITDVRNGYWGQYFGRVTDSWETGKYSRKEMYGRVIRGLNTVGETETADLFKDAIGLYSHLVEFVEEARVELGIPKPKEPNDDELNEKLSWFDDRDHQIETAVGAHIRDNIDRYEIKFPWP